MTLGNALSVLLAFGTLGALFAAPPADPQLITQAYVNGALNVGIWWYEGKYPDYTGPLKSAGLSYDVQMKGPGETEWSDVSGGWDTFDKNNDVFRCWYCRTNFVGSAMLRVRARNAAGETSGWVETDPLTATVNVKGTAIYGASCNGNAFDGRIGTWIDGTGDLDGRGPHVRPRRPSRHGRLVPWRRQQPRPVPGVPLRRQGDARRHGAAVPLGI